MYKHSETLDALNEYIGQQIKVYISEKNPYESYVGKLVEVNKENILVDCNMMHSTRKKVLYFFSPSNYITKILCASTWDKKLYESIRVPEEALADIRNTLGPVKNLLALLKAHGINDNINPKIKELIENDIKLSEAAVEYLSNLNTL